MRKTALGAEAIGSLELLGAEIVRDDVQVDRVGGQLVVVLLDRRGDGDLVGVDHRVRRSVVTRLEALPAVGARGRVVHVRRRLVGDDTATRGREPEGPVVVGRQLHLRVEVDDAVDEGLVSAADDLDERCGDLAVRLVHADRAGRARGLAVGVGTHGAGGALWRLAVRVSTGRARRAMRGAAVRRGADGTGRARGNLAVRVRADRSVGADRRRVLVALLRVRGLRALVGLRRADLLGGDAAVLGEPRFRGGAIGVDDRHLAAVELVDRLRVGDVDVGRRVAGVLRVALAGRRGRDRSRAGSALGGRLAGNAAVAGAGVGRTDTARRTSAGASVALRLLDAPRSRSRGLERVVDRRPTSVRGLYLEGERLQLRLGAGRDLEATGLCRNRSLHLDDHPHRDVSGGVAGVAGLLEPLCAGQQVAAQLVERDLAGLTVVGEGDPIGPAPLAATVVGLLDLPAVLVGVERAAVVVADVALEPLGVRDLDVDRRLDREPQEGLDAAVAGQHGLGLRLGGGLGQRGADPRASRSRRGEANEQGEHREEREEPPRSAVAHGGVDLRGGLGCRVSERVVLDRLGIGATTEEHRPFSLQSWIYTLYSVALLGRGWTGCCTQAITSWLYPCEQYPVHPNEPWFPKFRVVEFLV